MSIVLLLLACPKSEPAGGPAGVVNGFYRATSGLFHTGVQSTDAELRLAAPYLSRRLNSLLRGAVAYRLEWGRQHPDEPSPNGGPPIIYKPPFADGFNFTGNEEGFTQFKTSKVVAGPNGTWLVHTNFSYGRFAWEGVVVVRQEGKQYVIDDVILPTRDPRDLRFRVSDVLAWRE